MRTLIVGLLLCGMAVAACAEDVTVKVYVDGKLQKYDPPARIRTGKTYVPLRQGAESVGAECKWLAKASTAQICTDDRCILIRKSEGIIVGGRLFLPLRKMGEAVGAKVAWDAKKKAVFIESVKLGRQ